jgi:hypothetical protein
MRKTTVLMLGTAMALTLSACDDSTKRRTPPARPVVPVNPTLEGGTEDQDKFKTGKTDSLQNQPCSRRGQERRDMATGIQLVCTTTSTQGLIWLPKK